MRTLRQSNKGRTTDADRMNNKHREGRIWYVTTVDLRNIYTGSALILRNKTMHHNIQTQDNNKADIPPRVQEEVHRKDNNNRIRAIRTEKERVRRVRMMLRVRTIRVKVVRDKQSPARRQRRTEIQITQSTQVRIMDMDMDMMTIRITPQTNKTRNQKRPNRRKKNHMTMRKDGRVNMDTRSRRSRSQLRATSQS